MEVNIAISDTVVLSTRQTNKEFEFEAKRAIALMFYKSEKLSLGQAAELAGLSKYEFMKFLGENNVSVFRFDGDDLEVDLQKDIDNAECCSEQLFIV